MQAILRLLLTAALMLGLLGCSNSDKEKARQREAEAQQKAEEAAKRAKVEAEKLGHEAKQQARDLNQKLGKEVQSGQPDARTKLERAEMITKVKARLANEVGLRTLVDVDVDPSGHVVTLRGTVANQAEKQQAERAASEVAGVTRVVDELRVESE